MSVCLAGPISVCGGASLRPSNVCMRVTSVVYKRQSERITGLQIDRGASQHATTMVGLFYLRAAGALRDNSLLTGGSCTEYCSIARTAQFRLACCHAY